MTEYQDRLYLSHDLRKRRQRQRSLDRWTWVLAFAAVGILLVLAAYGLI